MASQTNAMRKSYHFKSICHEPKAYLVALAHTHTHTFCGKTKANTNDNRHSHLSFIAMTFDFVGLLLWPVIIGYFYNQTDQNNCMLKLTKVKKNHLYIWDALLSKHRILNNKKRSLYLILYSSNVLGSINEFKFNTQHGASLNGSLK